MMWIHRPLLHTIGAKTREPRTASLVWGCNADDYVVAA
jgi:hypothetical protein